MKPRELFCPGRLPVYQNKMFSSKTDALDCPVGEVRIVQDPTTGLVRNDAYDPGVLAYDDSYQNEQTCSPSFRGHIETVGRILRKYRSVKTILEIGCGKGVFVEHLRQQGYQAFGMDPAYEGNHTYIRKTRFSGQADLDIVIDCVVLRHVLEHIPDPLAFLEDVQKVTAGNAIVYIEVPCLDWILGHNAWFDIFYEHVNYFRVQDFLGMFARVFETGRLFGGQYLYAVADLSSLRQPGMSEPVQFPADFLHGLNQLRTWGAHEPRLAVWGAAAKGMMVAYYLREAGVNLDCAIDVNPAKQGNYLAGSGVPILSPDDARGRLQPRDVVLVANSCYLEEIIAMSRGEYSYRPVDSRPQR
jgi:SAM-dependent methyltransferase